jgi:hypothetical protein
MRKIQNNRRPGSNGIYDCMGSWYLHVDGAWFKANGPLDEPTLAWVRCRKPGDPGEAPVEPPPVALYTWFEAP